VVTVEVPEVPVRELNEITNSFSNENLIGQGSYAKVYRVLMRGARPAVVKKLEKPSKHASNVVFLKQVRSSSRCFLPMLTLLLLTIYICSCRWRRG
jgi:pto-interacting protein 1